MNVQQLSALMQSRQSKRHICFEKVLEQCYAFIRRHAEKNVKFCFFEVPDFLIGYPLFDLNECIQYISDKLSSNDFLVRYFFPRILYISWDLNEIKEEKLRKDMSIIKALEGPPLPKKRAPRVKAALPTPTANGKSVSFVRSVKEFKPSGKIVLNL